MPREPAVGALMGVSRSGAVEPGQAALQMRLWHALQVYLARILPLPLAVKERLIWWVSPRYRLGVHAVILDECGRVLTLRSTYSGRWQLPGGTVDYGEDFDGAIRREAFEELGLGFATLQRIGTYRDGTGRQVHAIYRATLAPGAIRLSVEHRRWRYNPPHRLTPFYRAVVAQALHSCAGELRLPG